jgi:hypothetical protein
MTASVQGASDANASNPPPVAISFPFVIGNASTLFNTLNAAFDDLAAPAVTCPGSPGTAAGTSGTGANSGIDFGLPAFMGLNMYVGLETNSFVVGTTTYYGPLWAF